MINNLGLPKDYHPAPIRAKLAVPLMCLTLVAIVVALYFRESMVGWVAALAALVSLVASMICGITANTKEIEVLLALGREHDQLLYRLLEDPENAIAHRNEMNERIAKITGLPVSEVIDRGL